ncbi:MAG: asparagine synthase (glutamine-hydrolyzing) [Patescibacteria group bacterium]
MCGINGFSQNNPDRLVMMNEATKHRGPDFSGTYFDDSLSLGHCLLSIRDSEERSHQPYMPNPEWVLLLNGQIYNTRQLKEELTGLDQTKSDLDTYVLYKTIEKYGWNFIYKIHGMFTIALYNSREKKLRLYRDPSGQKNLYYYQKGDTFIFSSEIKSILIHDIDKTVSKEGVALATALGYVAGPYTLFKHIRKIEPSQYLSWDSASKLVSVAYFKSEANQYFPESWEGAFKQLTLEHLQSKQKVAINLSGGLDSSLLLHEARQAGYEVSTYTTRFDGGDKKYNLDADLAQRLAKDYGTRHQEILVTKKTYIENFIKAYETIEEPNFNISLPAYLQTASVEGARGDKNRVVISGNGGDEIFGGYPHYEQIRKIEKQIKWLTPWLFNLIKNYRNNTDYDFRDMNERWLFFREFRFKTAMPEISKYAIPELLGQITQGLVDMYGVNHEAVYQAMLRERFIWMPAENFIQTDKIYMSQSAELRSPLSYHPFRLYCDKKLTKEDYTDKNSNKLFLRNLYEGRLPEYITGRKDKTGWRSPITDWYDGSFKKLFLEIISDRKSNEYIDWEKVRHCIESGDTWPGKHIHLYLSLAILARKYNINL